MATEYTVGSGGDYEEPYAAWSPYSGGTLTDDLIFTIISSCTLSADMFGGISFVNFGGYTVTWQVQSGGEHNGAINDGYIITVPDNMTFSINGNTFDSGTLNLNGLNFHMYGDGGSGANFNVRLGARSKTFNVNGCVFYSVTGSSDGALFLGPGGIHEATYNISSTKISSEDGLSLPAIQLTGHTGGSATFENVTIYNHGNLTTDTLSSVYLSATNATLTNVASIASNASRKQFYIGSATTAYCADSDGSLADNGTNIRNLTTAEFQSITSTDDTFLLPALNQNIIDGGTTPTLESTDIAGLTYGSGGLYPIGCHQYVSQAISGPQFTSRTTIGAKVESSAYTYDQPTATDFDFRAYNISASPEVESVVIDYATGCFSKHGYIIGKRTGTISFSVDMGYSGSNTTKPSWSKLLEACGYTASVVGDGVVWLTDSYACTNPLSIEVQIPQGNSNPSAVVLRFRGCKGNVKFEQANIGNAMRMDFEFAGVLNEIADRVPGTLITPSFRGDEAEAVLGSTITAFGDVIDIESLSLDTRNRVRKYTSPSHSQGVKGAYIVNRDAPSLQIDPYTNLLADSNMYNRWANGTTGVLSMTIGQHFTLSASAVQITEAYGTSDRGKMSTNQISAVCGKVGSDQIDGVVMLVQGNG